MRRLLLVNLFAKPKRRLEVSYFPPFILLHFIFCQIYFWTKTDTIRYHTMRLLRKKDKE
jgi:hypothetical protein